MLSKDDILASPGLRVESIEAFGGNVYIREMNGIERDRLANMFVESSANGVNKLPEGYKVQVALWCLCDEHGNSLFSDADVDALKLKPASEISKVADKAMSLSEIEENEDAEGN